MGALPPLPLGGPGTQQGHRCLECCGSLSTGLEVKRLAALGDLDPTQQKAESSRLSLPGPCRGEPPSLRRALRSHSTTRTRLKSLHAAPRPLALPSEYPGSHFEVVSLQIPQRATGFTEALKTKKMW